MNLIFEEVFWVYFFNFIDAGFWGERKKKEGKKIGVEVILCRYF